MVLTHIWFVLIDLLLL